MVHRNSPLEPRSVNATSTAMPTATLTAMLTEMGVDVASTDDGRVAVTLEGEDKQRISVQLEVGRHALTIQAFVARRPQEHAEELYRWLLERNLRMYTMAFAIDAVGDIYLVGRTPLASLDAEELDRILGCVLDYADSSFNTILRIGFEGSIRREWQWRLSRGESTANLAAFPDLKGG